MGDSASQTSFDDYAKRLREHHERLRASGEPLFVGGDGEDEGESVVMSREAYEDLYELIDLPEILDAIKRSEAEIDAGLGMSPDEVRERLLSKFRPNRSA
ncbi:MAG: hypothetical protein AAGI17_08125 [Planctomycetota bacterium]